MANFFEVNGIVDSLAIDMAKPIVESKEKDSCSIVTLKDGRKALVHSKFLKSDGWELDKKSNTSTHPDLTTFKSRRVTQDENGDDITVYDLWITNDPPKRTVRKASTELS